MSDNHPLLIYRSDATLYDHLLKFFGEGIGKSERCVFITSQNDGDKIFQNLKKIQDSSKVVRLFAYFSVPDPMISSTEFEKKWTKLADMFINENFRGRIGFNVLCDVSRFSSDLISKIEGVEKYIHSISNPNSKFLCTYKLGEKNDSLSDMLKIGFTMHDAITTENDENLSEYK